MDRGGRWGKKKHAYIHTHTYTTIAYKRIHIIKRLPEAVVGTKKTHTHTQQQHINAYTMPNDHTRRPLGQNQNTYTRTLYIKNNNIARHIQYQTATGGGRWDKQQIYIYIHIHTHTNATTTQNRVHNTKRQREAVVGTKEKHTHAYTRTHNNNTETHTQYQTTT